MEKLTGHGRPHNHLIGEVGQHYEDLNTGDIYECRVASQWSPIHGWPVGGYVWERRAKGEDIREIYGGSGGDWDMIIRIEQNDNATGEGDDYLGEVVHGEYDVIYNKLAECKMPKIFVYCDTMYGSYMFNYCGVSNSVMVSSPTSFCAYIRVGQSRLKIGVNNENKVTSIYRYSDEY